MVALSLIDVSKRFVDRPVLDEISLRAPRGEFLVLVGASGSGKSTLLNIIAGLETATVGSVRFDDLDVTKLTPVERNVAMVFQSYGLYPTMTVQENLSFPLRIRGLSKMEIRRRVDDVARMLRIEELSTRKPNELSGGERQRVAIGRALVRKPAIFLLDEPLSNLDASLRTSMQFELKRLHEASGRTFVYVTHDASEAMTLATSIAVLERGRIVQFDRPMTVYDRPATRYVAALVGSPPMNFLNAELIAERSRSLLRIGEALLELPQASAAAAMRAARVVAGFRPEHATFERAAESSTLRGVVRGMRGMGPDHHAFLDMWGQQIMIRVPHDVSMSPGMQVSFSVTPSRWNLYCSSSGARLN